MLLVICTWNCNYLKPDTTRDFQLMQMSFACLVILDAFPIVEIPLFHLYHSSYIFTNSVPSGVFRWGLRKTWMKNKNLNTPEHFFGSCFRARCLQPGEGRKGSGWSLQPGGLRRQYHLWQVLEWSRLLIVKDVKLKADFYSGYGVVACISDIRVLITGVSCVCTGLNSSSIGGVGKWQETRSLKVIFESQMNF